MQIEILSKDKEQGHISFILKDSSVFFANTLRRMILEEVPTLAMEDIAFKDNSSALYDEIIAHRLGLIPITTDLKSYNLPADCTCKGKGCAKCTVQMSLQVKSAGIVYAEEITSKDPKCKPVFGKTPIVKLIKGQSLAFEATAMLGQGKDHVKWSPGFAYYRSYPSLNVKGASKSQIADAVSRCNGLLKEEGQGLVITDITKWNESYEQICEENGIEILGSETDFIFYLESWGQLEPLEILTTAMDYFEKKLSTFEKKFK